MLKRLGSELSECVRHAAECNRRAGQSRGSMHHNIFGSSEQRTRWLTNGLKSGQVASCDPFQAARF